MQIGIYGGSFNPVHYGHVGLAKWVAEHTDLDEVWMMVSPNNPLKDSRELADEQERLEGVRKAIEGINHPRQSRDVPSNCRGRDAHVPSNARVVACDFEFSLPRPSYTANTLRALAAAYPQHTFTLIIGEDNLRILPRWREWEYIVSHYRIFVYPRRGGGSGETTSGEMPASSVFFQPRLVGAHPDYSLLWCGLETAPPFLPRQVGTHPGNAQIIMLEGAPYFDISSTEIRNNLKINNPDMSGQVPKI